MVTCGGAAAMFILLMYLLLMLFQGIGLVGADGRVAAPNPLGTWKLLHSSIGISAMHMQLLNNNQVVIFDRTEVGPSNLTLPDPFAPPSCHPSPSLPPPHNPASNSDIHIPSPPDCTAHSLMYDIHTNTIRPLVVLTDTWCSSGSVLPNGTLVQTGGYGSGDRVVRLISPNPFSQWDEHPGYLGVRRWYASNQILPDGRVIVVGGRKEFSYEFFPKTRVTKFPFLLETKDGRTENNLYPFLHLLPDGTLFVFANNRAVILDYDTNRVIRTLPPIPGGDPRNYPSSGSSVLLPLRLTPGIHPSDVEAQVLICGGAPRGSYQSAKRKKKYIPALRTCGRIVVTDPSAEWKMETMPAARVMSDMIMLPTGDVLIINGASKGTAGWELGRDPEMRPLLYRPALEPDRRFKLLTPTTIPRMYHSSAILDPFGRVLVGGSNPHVHYNFSTGVAYPTELSLEAFHPPYLDRAFNILRPSITDWPANQVLRYGEQIVVPFTVRDYRPDLGGVRVALLAPPFATHSYSMNQRLLELIPAAVVLDPGPRLTYQIHTAAPPTPALAPPGYYLLFVVHAGVPSFSAWVQIVP